MSSTNIAIIHAVPGMTPGALQCLLQAGLAEVLPSAWTYPQLLKAGIAKDRAMQIFANRTVVNPTAIVNTLQRLQIKILTVHDDRYPNFLREIPSAPAILYVRGNIDALRNPGLAVVGTRRATPYGLTVTQRLIKPIAQRIPIISGLALGIDAGAHRAALQGHGITIAVLGTGVDQMYPREHTELAQQIIAAQGAIISEFPIGSGPERHHFPQRNRIISGLAKAVLLVEAGDRSGALITAKFAVEHNRDVLVVPGSILSPQSVGVLSWMKLGATPVTSTDDILQACGMAVAPQNTAQTKPKATTPDEATLLEFLSWQPIHVDELAEKSRLDTSRVSATLVLMELRGIVRHHGGMHYSLTEP